jgi:hypothetical protein
MHKILGSSLPDTAKCDVLRLDFPDRPNFLRMSRALRIYCYTVRESSLPEAMKQELTSPCVPSLTRTVRSSSPDRSRDTGGNGRALLSSQIDELAGSTRAVAQPVSRVICLRDASRSFAAGGKSLSTATH